MAGEFFIFKLRRCGSIMNTGSFWRFASSG